MARLPYLDQADLAPENKDLLNRVINITRILVHNPDAARAFHGVGNYIRFKSKLDPRLRELAILEVGWLSRSPFEWSHHVKLGYDFGVTDDDIKGLIAEAGGQPNNLDPLSRLVLKAAREITNDLGTSDATFAALQQHFPNDQIIDLVLSTAFYCAVVRILGTFQVDVEPDYQPYMDKYPFPAA
jgi:alkylhydroperoxidase family enzyme